MKIISKRVTNKTTNLGPLIIESWMNMDWWIWRLIKWMERTKCIQISLQMSPLLEIKNRTMFNLGRKITRDNLMESVDAWMSLDLSTKEVSGMEQHMDTCDRLILYRVIRLSFITQIAMIHLIISNTDFQLKLMIKIRSNLPIWINKTM